jgi:hypothetical protein
MDPNETLRQIREAIADAWAAPFDEQFTHLVDVVELFQDLDAWLSRGGFKPSDWSPVWD